MPITVKIGKPNKGSVRLDLNVRKEYERRSYDF